MRRTLLALGLSLWVGMLIPVMGEADDKIAVLDDCDPLAWVGLGGCALNGLVTVAEFNAFLPPGHPAWRNEPSYVVIKPGERVKISNEGGRNHTFTQVAAYGGGFVAGLNAALGLVPVGECAGGIANPSVSATFLAPNARLEVSGLGVGTHRFQCCIHPWMRAAIKVVPE